MLVGRDPRPVPGVLEHAEEQRRKQRQRRKRPQIAPQAQQSRLSGKAPVLLHQADQIPQAHRRRQHGADGKFLPAPEQARECERRAQDQRQSFGGVRPLHRGQQQAHAAHGPYAAGLGEVHAQIAVGAEGTEDHRRHHQCRQQPKPAQQAPGNGGKAQQQHQILTGGVPVEAVAEGGIQHLQQRAEEDVDVGHIGRLVAELTIHKLRHEQVVVGLPHGSKGRQHQGKKQDVDEHGRQDPGPGFIVPGSSQLHGAASSPARMR